MSGFSRELQGIAWVWAVCAPIWLLGVAALAWGRVPLRATEVVRALAWTLAVSVLLAWPLVWFSLAYCAQFNPGPKSPAFRTGGLFATMLFPVYSFLVAAASFGLAVEAAKRRGATARSRTVRVLAGLLIAVLVVLAAVLLLLGCFFAAGPKAMG